jgi:nucleoside-diphosphate-sugar epimerase
VSGASADGGVLVLGATGRTGGRVVAELLARGVPVRALVRSKARVPASLAGHPRLAVVEADVASMPVERWRDHLAGQRAVVSCLGHAVSLRGVFGPPRGLVEGAVRRVVQAAEGLRPAAPLRLILMSSVSVHRPAPADARRGAGERAFLWALRGLVPPARDNQRAADALANEVGLAHPSVAWVVVRPDTLVEGDASAYRTHDGLVASLFRPDRTRMANAARFMAELATDEALWTRWRGRMPVVVDAPADAAAGTA